MEQLRYFSIDFVALMQSARDLDDSEFRAYMSLIEYCWLNGSVPNDPKRIARITAFNGCTDAILTKFSKHEKDGVAYLALEWLEETRQMAKNSQAARIKGGKNRWKKQHKMGISSAQAQHDSSAQAVAVSKVKVSKEKISKEKEPSKSHSGEKDAGDKEKPIVRQMTDLFVAEWANKYNGQKYPSTKGDWVQFQSVFKKLDQDTQKMSDFIGWFLYEADWVDGQGHRIALMPGQLPKYIAARNSNPHGIVLSEREKKSLAARAAFLGERT